MDNLTLPTLLLCESAEQHEDGTVSMSRAGLSSGHLIGGTATRMVLVAQIAWPKLAEQGPQVAVRISIAGPNGNEVTSGEGVLDLQAGTDHGWLLAPFEFDAPSIGSYVWQVDVNSSRLGSLTWTRES